MTTVAPTATAATAPGITTTTLADLIERLRRDPELDLGPNTNVIITSVARDADDWATQINLALVHDEYDGPMPEGTELAAGNTGVHAEAYFNGTPDKRIADAVVAALRSFESAKPVTYRFSHERTGVLIRFNAAGEQQELPVGHSYDLLGLDSRPGHITPVSIKGRVKTTHR